MAKILVSVLPVTIIYQALLLHVHGEVNAYKG